MLQRILAQYQNSTSMQTFLSPSKFPVIKKDHASIPNRQNPLNAPARFSSTRMFHFSMKEKMKDAFFVADCSFSQIFCTKGACVTEALTEAALSQSA